MTLTWSWSAAKAAFFPNELRALYVAQGGWPADAIPVTEAVYDASMPGAPDGKMLAADANGQPVRVALTPPPS